MNLAASLGVSAHTFAPDEAPATAPATITVPSRRGRPAGSKNYGDQLDYTRFVVWAIACSHFPMPEEVTAKFGCHKATANRWLNNFSRATGRHRPLRDAGGNVRTDGSEA